MLFTLPIITCTCETKPNNNYCLGNILTCICVRWECWCALLELVSELARLYPKSMLMEVCRLTPLPALCHGLHFNVRFLQANHEQWLAFRVIMPPGLIMRCHEKTLDSLACWMLLSVLRFTHNISVFCWACVQSLSRLAASFKTKREWPVTPVLPGDLLDGGQLQSVF